MKTDKELLNGCGEENNYDYQRDFFTDKCRKGNLCDKCKYILRGRKDARKEIRNMVTTMISISRAALDSYDDDYIILEDLNREIDKLLL
jgi:hypothetical protein